MHKNILFFLLQAIVADVSQVNLIVKHQLSDISSDCALMLTFETLSPEKETNTLAQLLSNMFCL